MIIIRTTRIMFIEPVYLFFSKFWINPPPPIAYLLKKLAITRLRKELADTSPSKIIEYVDFSSSFNIAPLFGFISLSIEPLQIKEEIIQFLRLIKIIKPKIILEIGTGLGGTLFLFSKVAPKEATIISIGFNSVFNPAWKTSFYRSFCHRLQKIFLIRADSHSLDTLTEVEKILDFRMVDVLFIDGDHTYEGVKKDFELYSSLVKVGGIIAFHDICPGPAKDNVGVLEFWSECRKHFNYEEIIKDFQQGSHGIGVIFME